MAHAVAVSSAFANHQSLSRDINAPTSTQAVLSTCCAVRTTLVKQWVPGEDGAPAAQMNMVGLCDELNVSQSRPPGSGQQLCSFCDISLRTHRGSWDWRQGNLTSGQIVQPIATAG